METMETFLAFCQEIVAQKAIVDGFEAQRKEASTKLEKMKNEVVKKMEATEMQKLHVPGFGTFFRQKEFSVRVPKDHDAKTALFKYISDNKGEEVLLDLTSINSLTLKSFWNAERKIAIDAGNVDWAMPGLTEPEVYWKLGMRKGK